MKILRNFFTLFKFKQSLVRYISCKQPNKKFIFYGDFESVEIRIFISVILQFHSLKIFLRADREWRGNKTLKYYRGLVP